MIEVLTSFKEEFDTATLESNSFHPYLQITAGGMHLRSGYCKSMGEQMLSDKS